MQQPIIDHTVLLYLFKRTIMHKFKFPLIIHLLKNHITSKEGQRRYHSILSPFVLKGFTLAEILITLLIIGIIGSLVIPGIIQDTQQQEFKTALKKNFANLNQVFSRILIENAGTIKNLCPSVGWHDDSVFIMKLFKPYLNINKYCTDTDGDIDDCWHINSPATVHDLNGDDQIFWGSHYPGMILNDGTLLYFYGGKSDCSQNDSPYNNEYIRLAIDVNGFKKPDVIGKDIFIMHVLANKIVPFGIQGDDYENTCSSSSSGKGCSAKYLYQ